MHGQAKVKTSEEEKEKKRKEREQKAKVYRDGMNKILEKRRKEEYDDEALELISDILVSNPDIYTLWNYRKEILQSYEREKNHDDLACILSNEMRLTEICLRANPKSYCAWYHRLWILENMPYPDLEKELFLCTKYLKLDERNFHCWDYRRFVASKLGIAPAEELDYTTVKIEEDFSNYSSWHYRSKLLPLVFPDPSGLRPVDEETHLKELEIVQSACFTDPSDSSSWFYLRWLLGRSPPKTYPVQAFLHTKEKVACVFNQTPRSVRSPWNRFDENGYIWVRQLSEEEQKDDIEFTIFYNDDEELAIAFKADGKWLRKPEFDAPISPALKSTLLSTLASCDQLLELEPESKWTLLTSVVLMISIDRVTYRDEIIKRLSLLIKYDPYRKEYYNDFRSKFLIEEALQKFDSSTPREVDLRELSLTTLYHTHYLAFARAVDLSDNSLQESLSRLGCLINCEVLLLDSNELTSLKGFPRLPKLRRLSICSNKIKTPFVINDIIHDDTDLEIEIGGNLINMNIIKPADRNSSPNLP